jgi:hypothetical protein
MNALSFGRGRTETESSVSFQVGVNLKCGSGGFCGIKTGRAFVFSIFQIFNMKARLLLQKVFAYNRCLSERSEESLTQVIMVCYFA